MTRSDSIQSWSQRHGDMVREAAPEVPELRAHERRVLWQLVADTPAPARPRRPRRKTVVAGVVAIAAVSGVGAAAGEVLSAHTGRGPVDAEDAELGGPGERLDPAAPDFATVLDEVTTDIRFPSSQARDQALSWEVDDLSGGSAERTATVSAGAVRLWMSGHALCSWSNTWAVALRAGDPARARSARTVILGARGWPSIMDTDPDLSDESEFAWLPDLERAVRTEDPAAARDALHDHGACLPGLAPELGLGKRW